MSSQVYLQDVKTCKADIQWEPREDLSDFRDLSESLLIFEVVTFENLFVQKTKTKISGLGYDVKNT